MRPWRPYCIFIQDTDSMAIQHVSTSTYCKATRIRQRSVCCWARLHPKYDQTGIPQTIIIASHDASSTPYTQIVPPASAMGSSRAHLNTQTQRNTPHTKHPQVASHRGNFSERGDGVVWRYANPSYSSRFTPGLVATGLIVAALTAPSLGRVGCPGIGGC